MPLRAPLTLSLAALILGNLVPLAGAALLGWSVFELLILFWIENLVVGAINVLRMGTLLVLRAELLALVVIPFFVLHYGGFCAGHGFFLYTIFAPAELRHEPLREAARTILATDGMMLAIAALAVSHLVSFVGNFLIGGEYAKVDLGRLTKLPYTRIILLHVAIVIGGGAAMVLGQPVLALALLVVLKIVVDALAHVREHRALGEAAPWPGSRPYATPP